jgi:hypothetical protein
MQQVDLIVLEALAQHISCKVQRLVGRCKTKDNKQSHLQQIQQAFADVEAEGVAYRLARHIVKP